MSAVTRYKKIAERLARDARATSGLLVARDRRLFEKARHRESPRGGAVLIAPPGSGNIGDQAMVEAFIESAARPITIVVRNADDLVLEAGDADGVTVRVLPHLIFGEGARRRRDLLALRDLLQGASSLSLIGADMMDGGYSVQASVRRILVTEFAAAMNVPARILGFSWNGAPKPAAVTALKRATAAGVVAMLRDPISAQRVRAHGIGNVVDVADIVFTVGTTDDAAAEQYTASIDPSRPVALVNVSGLVARSVDQVGEYRKIVDHLRGTGHHVVLLPHVIRPNADDAVATRAVFDAVGTESVTHVDRLLTPREVRGLTARAAVTVSGRMHLSIMTLLNGTPAVTLATQGKVEGLMSLMGTADLTVVPGVGMGEAVVGVLQRLAAGEGATKRLIEANLPTVIALAEKNFDGLRIVTSPVSG